MTLHNGTDGHTDRRTDRVRRNVRPPPTEEGRIISERGLPSKPRKPFSELHDGIVHAIYLWNTDGTLTHEKFATNTKPEAFWC